MSTEAKPAKSKTCKHCNKKFVSYHHDQKFCSGKCVGASQRKNVEAICECCNKPFLLKQSNKPSKTCSRQCWAKMRSKQYSDGRMIEVRKAAQVVLDRKLAESKRLRAEAKMQKEASKHKCCSWCGSHFASVNPNQAYCGNKECSKDRASGLLRAKTYWSRPETRVCKCCGSEYGRDKSNASGYCSLDCSRKAAKKLRRKRLRSRPSDKVGTLFIAKKFNFICCDCGVTCIEPTGLCKPDEATIDHIIPVALGGSHTIDNMQLLCRSCNVKKGATHPYGGQKVCENTPVDRPALIGVFFDAN